MKVLAGAWYEVQLQPKHGAWTAPKCILQIEML